MRFTAHYITTGGQLQIDASSNKEGEILASFKDEMGEWTKEFIDKADFKRKIESFHIRETLMLSERSC